MICQTVTIATRLEQTEEVRNYFKNYITEYNRVYRELWHSMTRPEYRTRYPKESFFVTEMCQKHQMLKRTINSIRMDIKGKILALKALKETELNQLQLKILQKEKKIQTLTDNINQRKPFVEKNQLTKHPLESYRRWKQSLYYQKNKLNQMKQKYQNLEWQIKKNCFSMGFAGKDLFRKQYHLKENGYRTREKWYHDYVKTRDKNIFYLGSSDESAGNQMFQMSYHEETDDFSIKIRKEKKYCKSKDKTENYIIIPHINFKHLHQELVEVVRKGNAPLSFRIHREKNKWYLQCIFAICYEETEQRTTGKYGVLGLDYNDGFIEMSETDESGNLVGQYHYKLKYHGTGRKAENEIRQIVSRIVKLGEKKGKDIVIEHLDFKKTKAKTSVARSKKGKKYNRMLHLFDYGRYKETLKNSCHRHKVRLQLVNPKDTSKIGKEKYSEKKKLNVHQAASYVIARKGQGFSDKRSRKRKVVNH